MSALTLLQQETPTIVFAGGGTGGHLIPAIALARSFERAAESSGQSIRTHFLIPGKQLERTILDDHGMEYTLCGGVSPSGNPVRKAKAVLSLVRAYQACKRELAQLAPSAVIGVGGYGSVCGGFAARKLKLPLYLLEQNTMPGRVNRLMSRYARAMYAQWPLEREVKCEVHLLGNPVRKSIFRFERHEAARKLGLDPQRKTLLVMGGSQGASAINQFITNNLAEIDQRSHAMQVIHLTGSATFDACEQAWGSRTHKHLVLPYASDMAAILAASDLVLCRSGATTIAELTALGKPMALVPLPSSAEDHQRLNAEYVERRGAAELIEQSTLADQSTIRHVLDDLLLSDTARARMALRSMTLGEADAGDLIASAILEGIGLQPARSIDESKGDAGESRIAA